MSTSPAHPPVPLIGLAHGSREPQAAGVIAALMAEVGRLRPGLPTSAAFLDLTEPDLTTAMEAIGPRPVVVLPLLFTQAFHARVDTPAAVEQACAATGAQAVVGEILGLGAEVRRALQVRAAEAGIAADVPIALAAVGSADEAANAAVADFASRWSRFRDAPVTACFATAGEPKVRATVAGLAQGPGGSGAVVPLFLAPGLLLRSITAAAAEVGFGVSAPIGTLLAPLVLTRYDEALAAADQAGAGAP